MKGLSSNEQSPSLVAAFEALGNHTASHTKGSALRCVCGQATSQLTLSGHSSSFLKIKEITYLLARLLALVLSFLRIDPLIAKTEFFFLSRKEKKVDLFFVINLNFLRLALVPMMQQY